MLKSVTMCQFRDGRIIYKIAGNLHTLTQLKERKFAGEMVVKMVKLAYKKMETQKTYAIINGNDKLLVLKIHETKYFVITVLVDGMIVKDTDKIYIEEWYYEIIRGNYCYK